MNLLLPLALCGLFGALDPFAPADYEELRRQAEAKVAEGSFALAHRLYEEAATLELAAGERRWVDFRLADTAWRSAAATEDRDTTEIDAARQSLAKLAPRDARDEERDLVWAEVQESLADLAWTREPGRDWGDAQGRYQLALDWWAGISAVETARARYLGMVWKMARPPWHERYWGHTLNHGHMSAPVLENAVKIATADEDVSRARYLLGMYYFHQGQNWQVAGRVLRELEAVIELGPAYEWYDDALYQRALYLANTGRATRDADGTWRWTPDYVEALRGFRRVLSEFKKGETPYWDDARGQIEAITGPILGVDADRFFLPGSEIQLRLSWRNVERIDLSLHAVDLVGDVDFADREPGQWLDSLRIEKREAHRRWTHATKDDGTHQTGTAEIALEEPLARGPWVVVAAAGGLQRRALVLVSDAAVTVRATSSALLAWCTDVASGAPIPGALVHVWERRYDGNDWRWTEAEGETGEDGTVLLDIRRPDRNGGYYLAFRKEDRQGFAVSSMPSPLRPTESWRIYAATDRSTYRPLDEVGWKFVARAYDGRTYTTPASAEIGWEIRDPNGTIVGDGVEKLNAFGSAWTTFATKTEMPLGVYSATFFADPKGKRRHIGGAELFRLEEYKQPEFEVAIDVPDDSRKPGSPRLYVVGDRVEFDVEATYYFGGPVAEASVEVFVYQRPFHHTWTEKREYPWFYPEEEDGSWWGGPGQQILHETLRTDLVGRAKVVFDSSPDAGSDLEYTIEARVTDSSRREIAGRGTVRVTRQEHYVRVETAHRIHRTGRSVDLEFTAADPNGNPVAAEGRVRVLRQRWIEVWRDPRGQKVEGPALSEARRAHPVWPPPIEADRRPWRIEFRGYEDVEVAATQLATNPADGKARWEFTPDRDGTYRVVWVGKDGRGTPVDGETTVFVADEDTRELGYLPDGVEILVDRDTLEVGEEAAILLTAPVSGRHVLFTVEGDDLYHHEVVHLTGTVKLLRLPIREMHVPNVWLVAMSVWDGRGYADAEELVVPPAKQFLAVTVEPSADAYLPGETGALKVTVRDHAGRPAVVELAIAVSDAALAYIQGDLAGDPRRFFFGERRGHRIHPAGSFHHGAFVRLVEKEDGKIVDERYAWGVDLDEGEARRLNEEKLGMLRDLGYAGETAEDGFSLGKGARMRAGFAPATPVPGGPPAESRRMEADSAELGQYRGPGDSMRPGVAGADGPAVRVRTDFRDTALWAPAVVTAADGTATVEVKHPDSTTRWRSLVRAIDAGTRVGVGEAATRTRQPVLARLQTPRFFQTGDLVTISGLLNNNTEKERTLRATLAVEGLELLGSLAGGVLRDGPPEPVRVPAGGEARVEWQVRVATPGTAVLTLRAQDDEHGDAMERRLPVHSRGIEVFLAESGKFSGRRLAFGVDLPAARRPGTTNLVVQITPSLAVTMLDALPYLAGYPYGCTEQTLSRFLPSAIVAKTLRDCGLSAEDAMGRVFGGVEQGFADRTHSEGKKPLAELDRMVDEGLARLYDFQHADGGWAWWKTGPSDRFMTAYVLWGLSLARDGGIDVRAGVLEKAAGWLAAELVEAENEPDLAAWMLHALATCGGDLGADGTRFRDRAFARLMKEDRTRLNAYTRALLALSAQRLGRTEEARRLLDNLYNGVKIDATPDTSIVLAGAQESQPYVLKTAHWGSDGVWRRWSEGPVETTAFALRAILAIDPQHELVEPVTNWLVKNRRGAQWSNTRDTAIAVLALNDYLRASGALAAPVGYDLVVNGARIVSRTLAPADLLAAPSAFAVDAELIRDGANEIVIERTSGEAPLYFAAHATFFSLEEPIPARGNEIFVRREYYKLVGRPTLLKGYVYDRLPLGDGETVESGQRIEVVVTVEAKNDLEYLVFEDKKPAGFEAVQVRSGEDLVARQLQRGEAAARFNPSLVPAGQAARKAGGARDPRERAFRGEGYTGVTTGAHQELRDRQVAMFVDRLPEGFWELRYDLRAEVPGRFAAMPLTAHAMYVPEIRANDRDQRVEVVDAADRGE
ncbi:MAG: alpha-2-macroglobulin family protein [Planctomycetota bacterium]